MRRRHSPYPHGLSRTLPWSGMICGATVTLLAVHPLRAWRYRSPGRRDPTGAPPPQRLVRYRRCQPPQSPCTIGSGCAPVPFHDRLRAVLESSPYASRSCRVFTPNMMVYRTGDRLNTVRSDSSKGRFLRSDLGNLRRGNQRVLDRVLPQFGVAVDFQLSHDFLLMEANCSNRNIENGSDFLG